MTIFRHPIAHVIGNPIAQSKSPIIHGYWLEKLGLAGSYSAELVETASLADYLSKHRQNTAWSGCNVTMPHKQAVIPLLDALDPAARKIGAVNTIIRRDDGNLIGYNTDLHGFLEPLNKILASQHLFRMARILGTGGAARAIIPALAQNGFTLVVAGRDPEKARKLLDELAPEGEHHAVDIRHFAEPTDFAFDDREGCLDLVVNASSLGMTGNPALEFDWSHAPPNSVAYDIITSPVETPFLQAARAAGHPAINGLSMLVGQAAIAFEKFFGATPPREHDAGLLEVLNR